jgi:3-hydroxymyristoyl/3-hydroxydecanoyl-(acyl carrier protein) dehydratase
MKPLSPEIRAERRSGDRIELDLYVPPDLAHFDGHFPGLPVLPGVVQVDWAVRYARSRYAWEGGFLAAENLRFQSLVHPGALLTLTLSLQGAAGRLAFAYSSRGRKCSSGTLVFGAP